MRHFEGNVSGIMPNISIIHCLYNKYVSVSSIYETNPTYNV